MPYLGNVPAEAYSQMSYQDLTGGSGTSFTLDYPVGNENEIEVFVNNVRQEPTVAYTTAGTALTMTGTIAATDDFYVVFQGKAQQTIGIPEKQTNGDYNFDSGTLFVDASTNRIGINSTSPSAILEIDKATANYIRFADGGSLSGIVGISDEGTLVTGTADGDLVLRSEAASSSIVFGGTGGGRFGAFDSDGLKFNSDTAAANALDDYEEGSWSPALNTGFPGSPSPVINKATYTKIGRTVHATCFINAANDGTSMQIGGLPFACAGGTVSSVNIGHESETIRFERMDPGNSHFNYTISGTNASLQEYYVSITYTA